MRLNPPAERHNAGSRLLARSIYSIYLLHRPGTNSGKPVRQLQVFASPVERHRDGVRGASPEPMVGNCRRSFGNKQNNRRVSPSFYLFRFILSDHRSSRSTATLSFVGSWAWASAMRYETMLCSPRIGLVSAPRSQVAQTGHIGLAIQVQMHYAQPDQASQTHRYNVPNSNEFFKRGVVIQTESAGWL